MATALSRYEDDIPSGGGGGGVGSVDVGRTMDHSTSFPSAVYFHQGSSGNSSKPSHHDGILVLFENIDTLQLCVLARSLGGRRHVCCRVVSGRSRRGRLHVVCRCCSATSSSLRRRGAVGARDGHDTHRVGNTSTYVVSWDSEARGDGPISEGCVVGMAVVFVSQLPLDIDPIQSFFPCLHSILLLQLAWAVGQLETDRLAEDEWCLAGRSVLAGRFLFVLAGSRPPVSRHSSLVRKLLALLPKPILGTVPGQKRSLPVEDGSIPSIVVGLVARESRWPPIPRAAWSLGAKRG